jgi:hypothetical protein
MARMAFIIFYTAALLACICRAVPAMVRGRGRQEGLQASQHEHMQPHTESALFRWAEARVKIARMTLTIKLDGNWSSFQLANNTPPLSVTGSVIAPSARMFSYQSYSTP